MRHILRRQFVTLIGINKNMALSTILVNGLGLYMDCRTQTSQQRSFGMMCEHGFASTAASNGRSQRTTNLTTLCRFDEGSCGKVMTFQILTWKVSSP